MRACVEAKPDLKVVGGGAPFGFGFFLLLLEPPIGSLRYDSSRKITAALLVYSANAEKRPRRSASRFCSLCTASAEGEEGATLEAMLCSYTGRARRLVPSTVSAPALQEYAFLEPPDTPYTKGDSRPPGRVFNGDKLDCD